MFKSKKYKSGLSTRSTKCYVYLIFLYFREDLSLYSTQVATVLTLFDVVLAMLLSVPTKYETKNVNGYLIVNDSAQRTYNILAFFYNQICKIELPNNVAIKPILIWPSIFLFC